MSRRLADVASGVLAARFSRRGFLARSAVVGSALVTNPVNFCSARGRRTRRSAARRQAATTASRSSAAR